MATNHLESSQSSAKAQFNWILKLKARIMENQHPVLGDEWCFMMPVKTTLVAEAFFKITGVSWNMRLQFLPLALEAKKRHHRMIQVYIYIDEYMYIYIYMNIYIYMYIQAFKKVYLYMRGMDLHMVGVKYTEISKNREYTIIVNLGRIVYLN